MQLCVRINLPLPCRGTTPPPAGRPEPANHQRSRCKHTTSFMRGGSQHTLTRRHRCRAIAHLYSSHTPVDNELNMSIKMERWRMRWQWQHGTNDCESRMERPKGWFEVGKRGSGRWRGGGVKSHHFANKTTCHLAAQEREELFWRGRLSDIGTCHFAC